jgi:Sulfotransferase family
MTTDSGPSPLRAPIFVVGHARSGTTLLATMLGRHPHLAATPETHFFNEGRYALAPQYAKGPATVARRIATTRLRHLEFAEAELAALLMAAPMTDTGVISTVLSAFLARSAKARVVEKTPVHIRHIDDILACLPDARIIWIQRDGRACIASLRKVDWATHDVVALSRQWTRNMGFGQLALRQHPAAILTTRYEDLTADPETEMTRILNWLGEPFSPATLDASQQVTTISKAEEGWKANVRKPILSDRAMAWQQELSAEQIAAANVIMGPMLRQLGYQVDGTAGQRLETWRQALQNSAPGVALQKMMFNRMARKRFAPWGANRGTKG